MVRVLIRLASVLAVSLMVFGCSKDSPTAANTTPTLDPNAGTLSTHAGANAVITDSSTARTLGTSVMSYSLTTMGKVMTAAQTAKMEAGAATQPGGTSGTFNKTINGTNSGTASVSGSWNYNQASSLYTYTATCVLSDYSEDGNIFLAGTLTSTITSEHDAITGASTMDYDIDGAVRFNGAYLGSVTYSYEYNLSGVTQTFDYTSTITSNNQSITYSYSYPAN